MSKMENLYEILKVDSGASTEELRKSYVRLAKLHHPDKSQHNDSDQSCNQNIPTEENESEFVKINHAWTILGNSELRKQFDVKWKERCLSQYLPIQETVLFTDFEFVENEQVYVYPCRCGSDYVLSRVDSQLYYDIVCCETCSLTIRVEYHQ